MTFTLINRNQGIWQFQKDGNLCFKKDSGSNDWCSKTSYGPHGPVMDIETGVIRISFTHRSPIFVS